MDLEEAQELQEGEIVHVTVWESATLWFRAHGRFLGWSAGGDGQTWARVKNSNGHEHSHVHRDYLRPGGPLCATCRQPIPQQERRALREGTPA